MPSNLKNSRINTNDVYVNVIDEKTSLEGAIICEGNFRIDGTFIGNINLIGKLLVGAKGRIEGQISSTDLILEGVIKGDLNVSNNLILKSKSRIDGEINAKRIEVELGAELKGHLRISPTTPPKENPQVKNTEEESNTSKL